MQPIKRMPHWLNASDVMTMGEHAFFDQHLSSFFYQAVFEPINLELNLTSSSESDDDSVQPLTDNIHIARSYISDSELYMNHVRDTNDLFTQ